MLLDAQTKYYRQNRERLEQMYNGKFIVIKARSVIGIYESHKAAYDETIKQHEVGTFIIENPVKKETTYSPTGEKITSKYNQLSYFIIITILLVSIAIYLKYESSLSQIDQKFNQAHSINR
jgi:hypothetical protein